MTRELPAFVSFQPSKGSAGKFVAFLPVDRVISSDRNPEILIRKAAITYEREIVRMRNVIARINAGRATRTLIPARTVWEIGNRVFRLREDLEKLSLQLDGLYAHLTRDLGVKRQWLEKVIIFRRYIPRKGLIPKDLNWGKCEKGTRRVADRLRSGISAD